MLRIVSLFIIAATLVTVSVVYALRAKAASGSPESADTALTAIPLRFIGRYRTVSGAYDVQSLEITSSAVITTGPEFGNPGNIKERREQPSEIRQRPDGALALTMRAGDLTWVDIFLVSEAGLTLYRESEGSISELGRFVRQ